MALFGTMCVDSDRKIENGLFGSLTVQAVHAARTAEPSFCQNQTRIRHVPFGFNKKTDEAENIGDRRMWDQKDQGHEADIVMRTRQYQ